MPCQKKIMRKSFAKELHKQMQANENIFLVVGDLGYKLFDEIRNDFPDRFINVNAAEQCMLGVGVGLALSGKIPFCYSITPFLLYRAAETIRNYVNHEAIPVRLCASGRDWCYKHDGHSHFCGDDSKLLDCFPNIYCQWPESENDVPALVEEMVNTGTPYYINLKR